MSILDGSGGSTVALAPGGDYREFAHFRAQNFNVAPGSSAGSFAIASSDDSSYWYFHDLELDSINRGQCSESNMIVFNLFSLGGVHMAVENISVTDFGGYFTRGSAGNGPAIGGPMRFQNMSLRHLACTGDDSTISKLWGYSNNLEWLDNHFDCNLDNWNGACLGLRPSQCTQDWTIRNNTFIDYAVTLNLQASADGACENSVARPVDDIVFDRNRSIANRAMSFAPVFVSLSDGGSADSPNESFNDVTVTNNFFFAADGYQNCLAYTGGNNSGSQPGQIVWANNTCHGYMNRPGWGAIDVADEHPFVHQDFVIANNIVSGLNSGNLNTNFGYAPAQWVMDANSYSPPGTFNIAPGPPTSSLGAWQANTGADASSTECTPQYVNLAAADLHLRSDDTCARSLGMPTGLPTLVFDIDGDRRPESGGDRGADDLAGIFRDGFEDALDPWSPWS